MAVAYLRVSTNRQGRSGLGLEAQREAVLAYVADRATRITAEFVEVESGRNADRPALAQALASARLHRVPLVVASVSRLTRSLGFLTRLLEAGADVRFCDLPQIEGPTGRFMLQQMAAVAELEAGMISARTKAALAAAKARGTVLGGYRGVSPDNAARDAAAAAKRHRRDARLADLAPVIAELRAGGFWSPRMIATELNARGITAPKGGAWAPGQVWRALDRMTVSV